METRKKLEALAFDVSHNLYYVNLTNVIFCKIVFLGYSFIRPVSPYPLLQSVQYRGRLKVEFQTAS